MPPEPVPDVHPSWLPALAGVDADLTRVRRAAAAEREAGLTVLPAAADELRALRLGLDDVRVLLLGQDPYPTPGHAVGLSFSVGAHVRPLPGSLRNVFAELVADTGVAAPASGDLSAWAGRGVLLLNRVLSVRAGEPGSHRGRGWEAVTGAVVSALAARWASGGPALVGLLWGRDAGTAARLLGGVPTVRCAHPSPLSAHRGFLGSRPFTRVDAALVAQGGEPMDWSLPPGP